MKNAKPTKRQRDVIGQHLSSPVLTTQAEVMKRLNLRSTNDFYRLAYRCLKADALDRMHAHE